jgi:hypothetical protein
MDLSSFHIRRLEEELPGIRAGQEQLPDKTAEGGASRNKG